MKYPDASRLHNWMDDRVEAYVDGDLPADERTTFEQVLNEHPQWMHEVRQAERIHHELNDFPALACPPQVTQAVLERTRFADQPPGWSDVWSQFWTQIDELTRFGWKPAMAMASLVMIVAAAVLFSPAPSTVGGTSYTTAEVERAEAQAKWALAYIAQVGDETQHTLRREVFQEQITRPTRRALRPLDARTESSRNR